jgi:predicted Zn-ribbon and HTH transcriptional regulator
MTTDINMSALTVRVLKCYVCEHSFRQKSNNGGCFPKETKCPKCGSTNVGTVRVYQADR